MAWSDLDSLSDWCPQLENLTLADNPIASGERHARQLITARIGTLTVLDGSAVCINLDQLIHGGGASDVTHFRVDLQQ